MIQYPKKTKTLISNFKKFSIEQVPRSKNKKADALSKIAFTSFAHLTKQVLEEVLKEKSIEEKESLADVEEEGYSWITSLLEYLMDGTLPAKTKRARAIKIKSRQYAIIGGVLFRRRSAIRAMRTSHNDQDQQWRHPILLNLWHGIRNPNRDKYAFTKLKAKREWRSTTTPRSTAQPFGQEISSTAAMKPATQKKVES
ncbi:hypothetical protein Tco_0698429 [Tanacetum coccineum]